MNKNVLRAAIIERLQSDMAQQTAAAQLARDEAISEESRPESKYDTHSQEAAYLAEAQARIANEISQSLSYYTSLPMPAFAAGAPIATGALVTLGSGSARRVYFVGARAGGLEVCCEGIEILVITPQSPLGRELVGRGPGDTVKLPGRAAPLAITAVE